MRINQKMTYEELVKMQNNVAELPFYVTRKVGAEFKVYAYSHSSMTNGYIRKNATYNPLPYKGRFGVGFTVKSNNSASTRYAYITYYIEIKQSVTVFNEEHNVLVGEFAVDCENFYTKRTENFLSEEVTAFEIVNGKLRLMIRGCE